MKNCFKIYIFSITTLVYGQIWIDAAPEILYYDNNPGQGNNNHNIMRPFINNNNYNFFLGFQNENYGSFEKIVIKTDDALYNYSKMIFFNDTENINHVKNPIIRLMYWE